MVELRGIRPEVCERCRTGPAQMCQRRHKHGMQFDRWLCWECYEAERKAVRGEAEDGDARG